MFIQSCLIRLYVLVLLFMVIELRAKTRKLRKYASSVICTLSEHISAMGTEKQNEVR